MTANSGHRQIFANHCISFWSLSHLNALSRRMPQLVPEQLAFPHRHRMFSLFAHAVCFHRDKLRLIEFMTRRCTHLVHRFCSMRRACACSGAQRAAQHVPARLRDASPSAGNAAREVKSTRITKSDAMAEYLLTDKDVRPAPDIAVLPGCACQCSACRVVQGRCCMMNRAYICLRLARYREHRCAKHLLTLLRMCSKVNIYTCMPLQGPHQLQHDRALLQMSSCGCTRRDACCK